MIQTAMHCYTHSKTVMLRPYYRYLSKLSRRLYSRGSGGEDPNEGGSGRVSRRVLKRMEKNRESDVLNRRKEKSDKATKVKSSLATMYRGETSAPQFKSDEELEREHLEKQRKKSKQDILFKPDKPLKHDPKTASVFLFPGQGSQFVGMGKKLIEYPQAAELYETASEFLGYDLLNICINGPKAELDKTVYCQPAVFVTSLAAAEVLREREPEAFNWILATSGFSLGEITACVFANVLSFQDGLKLVSVRAKAMQEASEEVNSGMLTLKLFYASKLRLAIGCAQEYCRFKLDIEEPILGVANYLSPEYKVIAGHDEALQFVMDNREDFNLRSMRRLPVSGAFHTKLMLQAKWAVKEILPELTFNRARFPIFTNVDGKLQKTERKIKENIVEQIVKPVLWEQIMHNIYQRPQGVAFPHTYECGPGGQLGHLLYCINRTAHKNYHKVEV